MMQQQSTRRESPYSVSIVQMALVHYNLPFFTLLADSLPGRLWIIAGQCFFSGSPVSVSETPGLHRINMRNVFIRDQLALQSPIPAEVFLSHIAVLEFNPRILSNLWILIHRKQLKRAVVLWGHGLSRRPNSTPLAKTIRKWMAQQADALIFYNDKGKLDFVNLGLPAEKLFVARNSIDVQSIHRLRVQSGGDDRQHVLFIGRLVPSKKVDLLIDGFAGAMDGLPSQTKLIIIGDGPERAKLVARAAERGVLKRVEFVGEITDDKLLAPCFTQSLLSVSPGPIGLSAIHSLAHGVPLLVADAEPHGPEIEALVQGRNSEFFTAGDTGALAGKLKALLAQPTKLSVMGQAGIEDVTKNYSLQRTVSVFLETFNYVLSKTQKTS